MTVKTEFQKAAVKLFNTFSSVLKQATYIQETSEYVAGGNLVTTSTTYSIRVLEETRRKTLTLSNDIPKDNMSYLAVVEELTFVPKLKDRLTIDGATKTIVGLEYDAANITVSFSLGAVSKREE